jgi:hypothetical protein
MMAFVAWGEPGYAEYAAWRNEVVARVESRRGHVLPEVRARFDAVMDRLCATRTINCLINEGIDPTGDLAEVRLIPDALLLRIPNFGKKSLAGLRKLAPYEGPPPTPRPPSKMDALRMRIDELEAELARLRETS